VIKRVLGINLFDKIQYTPGRLLKQVWGPQNVGAVKIKLLSQVVIGGETINIIFPLNLRDPMDVKFMIFIKYFKIFDDTKSKLKI